FENPYTDPDNAQRLVNNPASAAPADETHRQSIVLLRNDTQLLPPTGAKKIYVEVMAADGGGAARGGGGIRGGGQRGGRQAPAGGRGEPAPNPLNATAALKALL